MPGPTSVSGPPVHSPRPSLDANLLGEIREVLGIDSVSTPMEVLWSRDEDGLKTVGVRVSNGALPQEYTLHCSSYAGLWSVRLA